MSTVLVEVANHVIVKTEIDGVAPLCSNLIGQLDYALNQAEDAGPCSITLLHVVGHKDHSDFRPWPGQIDIQSINRWERVLRRIERSSIPTVVFVERFCSAVALELLLVADRRLGGSDLSIAIQDSGIGVWPGMALYRLSRQIGEARARKLYLDGISFTAERAVESDVLDEIIMNSTSWLERVADFLAHAPLDDFAICRRLFQDSQAMNFDEALGAHLAACDRSLRRNKIPVSTGP